jgi:formylmethanofuran dehydrogenase subunit A
VDVGQVLFGETTSMTADSPLGYYLHKVTGRKWTNADTEMEAGCGIVPITYKEKSFVHALQWAIGLEWYLLVQGPWRVAMTTDHPNGGSFLAYPEIVQLLMDRNYRAETLKRVHPRVLERSVLKDLDREYSLYEIAIITRAGPARMLGLPHKGHLGVGADADVTVYTPSADKKSMFELPRWVLKGGRLVVEQVPRHPGMNPGRDRHRLPALSGATPSGKSAVPLAALRSCCCHIVVRVRWGGGRSGRLQPVAGGLVRRPSSSRFGRCPS